MQAGDASAATRIANLVAFMALDTATGVPLRSARDCARTRSAPLCRGCAGAHSCAQNAEMRRLILVMGLVAAGCGDDTTAGNLDMTAVGDMAVPDLAMTATAARGEELVKHLLLCGSCHTTPDAMGNPSTNAADFLAGGRKFTVTLPGDGGSVSVYASNLTPDDATGLGTWTTGQIADAV